MLKAKTLEEKVEVGGGATGTSMVPDPVSTGDTSRRPDKKNAEGMNKLNTPNAAADASDEADAGKNEASIKASHLLLLQRWKILKYLLIQLSYSKLLVHKS